MNESNNISSHRKDMAYTFTVDSVYQTVYCHMGDLYGCGWGGWTLTMKIDGAKVICSHHHQCSLQLFGGVFEANFSL